MGKIQYIFLGLVFLKSNISAASDSKLKSVDSHLCKMSEKVVFSCKVKKGKLLSVCRTHELDHSVGTLQYRFGRSAKVELVYPQKESLGTKPFKWSRYTRPAPMATTILSLYFKNGGWTYTIFNHSHCEENECSESSGVRLEKGTKQIQIDCVAKPFHNTLWGLEGLVPEDY